MQDMVKDFIKITKLLFKGNGQEDLQKKVLWQ